jgi:hypothetical protein
MDLFVPLVTYQGMLEGLFVYTSPFAEGTPYISVLTSRTINCRSRIDGDCPDLADLVTRGARANTTIPDPISTEFMGLCVAWQARQQYLVGRQKASFFRRGNV